MSLFFSRLSEHLKMTLLALWLTLLAFLVHLVYKLLTATALNIRVRSFSWLWVKYPISLILWRSNIDILTKTRERILSIKCCCPSTTRSWMNSINLSSSSTSCSKQSFFVLPHAHGDALSLPRNIILNANADAHIDMLLTLPDCVSHVRSTTQVNIAFAQFMLWQSLWMLLLQLQTPVALRWWVI